MSNPFLGFPNENPVTEAYKTTDPGLSFHYTTIVYDETSNSVCSCVFDWDVTDSSTGGGRFGPYINSVCW